MLSFYINVLCNVLNNDCNEGNKPKHTGLTMKLFFQLQMLLKGCCFDIFRLFPLSMQQRSMWNCAPKKITALIIPALHKTSRCHYYTASPKLHVLSLPPILSFHVKDTLNETIEDPTLWTVTTLTGEQESDRIETKFKGSRGKEVVDGDSDAVSSLKINLTVINSTFNYSTTREVRTFHNKVCHP